jgi:hypothetical protein
VKSNIRRDPFEQNVGIDQKSAMSLGGALGAPATAFLYDWNMLPIGQQLWEKELLSYEKFSPLHAPETYNLSGIPLWGARQPGPKHENEPTAVCVRNPGRSRQPRPPRPSPMGRKVTHC